MDEQIAYPLLDRMSYPADHAAVPILKKIALNLIRADKTAKAETSQHLKRKRATWNDQAYVKMRGLTPP